MKQFFITIRDSIYNPKFYHELLKRPMGFSLKYFFLFILIVAILTTAVVSSQIIPLINRGVGTAAEQVLAQYPDELVITIKNGQASTNVAEPYAIKMPQEWLKAYTSQSSPEASWEPENLVVIDTSAVASSFSLDALKARKTATLLTKDALVVAKNPNELSVLPLKAIPDASVSKPMLTDLREKIRPWLKFLGPVVAFVLLVVIFIGGMSQLAYLLIAALLIWALTAIMKIKTGYTKAYQIGLHAITLPMIAGLLFDAIAHRPRAPFLFTILMLIVVGINLKPRSAALHGPHADTTSGG